VKRSATSVAAFLCALGLVEAQDPQARLLAAANAAYRSLHAAEAVSLYREYLAH
jgi:hypothetical protein